MAKTQNNDYSDDNQKRFTPLGYHTPFMEGGTLDVENPVFRKRMRKIVKSTLHQIGIR